MAHHIKVSGIHQAQADLADIGKTVDEEGSTEPSEWTEEEEVDLEVAVELPEALRDRIINIMCPQQKMHALFECTGFEEELYAERHAVFRAVLMAFSFLAIVVSCTIFTIESLPQFYEQDYAVFFIIEAVCITWFTAEIGLRFFAQKHKVDYFKSCFNWIDIISVTPFYLNLALGGSGEGTGMAALIRFIRLTRVFRVFKISKYNQDLHIVILAVSRSSDALSMLLFMVVISVVLFGAAMFYAEQTAATFDEETKRWIRKESYGGPEKAHPYQSIFHAFWWCFVTVTTVGYGDMYPVTLPGYLVATLAMITGLLIIAFPIIVLGTNFTEARINYFRSKQEEFILANMMKTELLTCWETHQGAISDEDIVLMLTADYAVDRIDVGDTELLDGNMQELNVTGLLETLRQRVEGLEQKVTEYELLFQALVESGKLGNPAKELAGKGARLQRVATNARLARVKSTVRSQRGSQISFRGFENLEMPGSPTAAGREHRRNTDTNGALPKTPLGLQKTPSFILTETRAQGNTGNADNLGLSGRNPLRPSVTSPALMSLAPMSTPGATLLVPGAMGDASSATKSACDAPACDNHDDAALPGSSDGNVNLEVNVPSSAASSPSEAGEGGDGPAAPCIDGSAEGTEDNNSTE
eukprot:TRINITY_DN7160_c0_g1_i1.p1 TRINITY_DN7160_c0_g1~~TRINITY_DN7160_c0_g1_i1.p1  ORF type:complete len:642 (+),score=204.29 TRINITY_DN7160_c0_g1_i1:133-2058(+)